MRIKKLYEKNLINEKRLNEKGVFYSKIIILGIIVYIKDLFFFVFLLINYLK